MSDLNHQRLEVRLRAIHCDPQRFVDKYPDDAVAICALIARKIQRCDWLNIEKYKSHLRHLVKTTPAYCDSTFCYIGTTQEEQYVNMLRGTIARYPNLAHNAQHTEKSAGRKIKVAYLSSDFHEHATSYLIAGLFEAHARDRFETYLFSCGADDNSPMRARLKAGCDEFIDLSGIKDYKMAADVIKSHDIDILVDLKGYTAGHCADIVAQRPARIIVSYLGWPSTTGGLCDYILADRIVIPEHNRQFFSEKVVWLPGSYQINEPIDKAYAAKKPKEDYGFSKDAVVYANFNQAYKITEKIWDKWMECLSSDENNILWQYYGRDPQAMQNLKAEAAKRGISENRIIGAKHINREGHLARFAAVDLVWDTQPVCGHTTTSDALRMGYIPIMPLKEQDAFISRVSHSLIANVDTLFNTQEKTKQIEEAYVIMMERYLDGKEPAHIEL